MAEQTIANAKLAQFLTEALTTEKQLETALEAHIGMTERAPYKKRLRQHLTETKRHAREVERRIKKLGGSPTLGEVTAAASALAGKAVAAAQGPVHALRGTSVEEKELRTYRRAASAAVKAVAAFLGNTPAVARASYIDPRVFDRFRSGWTIADTLRTVGEPDLSDPRKRARIESAVLELLEGE